MKKSERHRIIKQLITKNHVETQDELLRLLQENGVDATQATVSRDTKELRIVKMHAENGRTRYTILAPEESNLEVRLARSLHTYLKKMVQVQFMVIMHTEGGGADVIGNLIDEIKFEEVAGTIAGFDTFTIITYSETHAQQLIQRLETILLIE